MQTGVSLDLSKTRTGMAMWHDDKPVYLLSTSFTEYKYFGEMLAVFYNFVQEYVQPGERDWIAYEEVRPKHKLHMEQHFGMVGILARACWKEQVPLFGITSGQAKKYLSGSGKADKDMMLEAARQLYPDLNVRNHDEADALAVGFTLLSRVKDQ